MNFHWLYILLFLNITVKSQFVNYIDTSYNQIFPIIPNYILNSTNIECVKDSVLYLENFKNYTEWAFKMWDASSKGTVGQMVSESINTGHFDECLGIKAPFKTQHCTIHIKLTLEKSSNTTDSTVFDSILTPWNRFRNSRNFYRSGICLPNSCDYTTLKGYLDAQFDNYSKNNELNITYEVSLPSNACHSTKPDEYDVYDITFCALIGGLVILTIVSTLLRNFLNLQSNSPIQVVIRSFSLSHTIYEDLLKTDENSFKYLHGIKVFSIIWIIFGHCVAMSHGGVIYDYTYSESVFDYLVNYVVIRGDFWVDTFFCISGLLLSYLLLTQYSKKRKLNPIFLIILRYLRLTPVYAIIIFFIATLLAKMGNGPQWQLVVGSEKDMCRENWWLNLLYINNYVNTDRACLVTGWYLPCDMHFFIIGMFIIKLLHAKHKIGLTVLAIGTIISMAIPFLITYLNNLDGVVLFTQELIAQPRNDLVFNTRYIKSHTRMAPFLVGIFVGYIFFIQKELEIRLNQKKSILLGTLSVITLILLIISSRLFYVQNFPYPILAAISAGVSRFIWSIAISIFIFCLEYGKLDTLRSLLSTKVLVVFSKLTYSVYLFHPIYLLYKGGTQRVAYVQGDFIITNRWIHTTTVSYMFAFFAYILIEAPIRNILKLLLYPSKENKTTSNLVSTTVNDKKTTDLEKYSSTTKF